MTRVLEKRGLSLKEATHYGGLGTTKFDELVDDGTMPQPRMAGARMLWDVFELDAGRVPDGGVARCNLHMVGREP